MMVSILKSSKTLMKTRPFLMETKIHPFQDLVLFFALFRSFLQPFEKRSQTVRYDVFTWVACERTHCEPNSPSNLVDWAHAQTDSSKDPIGAHAIDHYTNTLATLLIWKDLKVAHPFWNRFQIGSYNKLSIVLSAVLIFGMW